MSTVAGEQSWLEGGVLGLSLEAARKTLPKEHRVAWGSQSWGGGTWILSSLICQLYVCQANKPGTPAYQSFCTDFAPWPLTVRAKELSQYPDHQGSGSCLGIPSFYRLRQLLKDARLEHKRKWSKMLKRQKAASAPCPVLFFTDDSDL